MILLFFCACGGPWSREAALLPALARLDVDRSGDVSAEEYARASWHAVPFERADGDGDGRLGLAEIDALLVSQDPLRFAQPAAVSTPGVLAPEGAPSTPLLPEPPELTRRRGPAPPAVAAPVASARSVDAGEAGPVAVQWAVLQALCAEVLARDPTARVPTDAEIEAAQDEGTFSAPHARAALATLEASFERAGLAFPPSLVQR